MLPLLSCAKNRKVDLIGCARIISYLDLPLRLAGRCEDHFKRVLFNLLQSSPTLNPQNIGINAAYFSLSPVQIRYFLEMSDKSVSCESIIFELKKRNDELKLHNERIFFLANEVVVMKSILDKKQDS